MSEADTYDARVRAIRVYNQPLLEDFRSWLEQSGIVLSATLGRQEGES